MIETTYISGLDLGQAQDFTALAVLERTRILPDAPRSPRNKTDKKVQYTHRTEPVVTTVSGAMGTVTSYTEPKNLLVDIVNEEVSVGSGDRVKDVLENIGKGVSNRKKINTSYTIRHLERFNLGTPYPTICDRIKEIYENEILTGSMLAVDKTGVGRAVVDDLIKVRPKCIIRPITITAGFRVIPDGAGYRVPKKELVGILQVLLQSNRLKVVPVLPDARILVREFQNFKVKINAHQNEQYESWRERDHDDLVLAVAMACWISEKGNKQFWLR